MNDYLVVSCMFGTGFDKVHPAPDALNSYFFSNNPELEQEAREKHWQFVLVDVPLSDDLFESSLQSKYIKFLQFLGDFREFEQYQRIIYLDHKERTSPASLQQIHELVVAHPDKAVIVRETPRLKESLREEVEASLGQERYARNMDKTVALIEEMVAAGQASQTVRICNTGLLVFTDPASIRGLTDAVYQQCMQHRQPQCQIYWSLFSQQYEDKILRIGWRDLESIERRRPV